MISLALVTSLVPTESPEIKIIRRAHELQGVIDHINEQLSIISIDQTILFGGNYYDLSSLGELINSLLDQTHGYSQSRTDEYREYLR